MADFTDVVSPTVTVGTPAHDEALVVSPTLVVGAFSEAGAVSSVAPSVVYVTPAGALDPTDPIVVDVLDTDSPAPSTFLFARFAANGAVEVVWDGAAFAPFYGTSTRVAVTDGHRYTLRRSGSGWIAGGITINANAIDDTGEVAV